MVGLLPRGRSALLDIRLRWPGEGPGRDRAAADRLVRCARDLPWRHNDPAVMVSEFMLQQTPVSRVLPLWQAWLERWPTPAALAAEQSSEAVRAWGTPRLPETRTSAACQRHRDHRTPRRSGSGPSRRTVGPARSRRLHGSRHRELRISGAAVPVLDTTAPGADLPRGGRGRAASLTKAERARAQLYTDAAGQLAPRWAAAVMEFGALVCLARRPRCASCPVAHACAWRAAGHPLPCRARASSVVAWQRPAVSRSVARCRPSITRRRPDTASARQLAPAGTGRGMPSPRWRPTGWYTRPQTR